ncbi:MAG: TIGR04551 family protein [Polyangiaceae bacterium]|nr:TIGR04551 family protein [Polyangiaceae bacterium]
MKRAALALASALLLAPQTALATGFTEIGQDIRPRTDASFKLEGYFRTRGESLYNLDLDRGLTPSGQPLFPVPSDGGQSLYGGDLRLRTDLSIYAPGGTVAVKVRIDTLDNLAAGSSAVGNYAASTTQVSPDGAMRVKRAYGTVLTPIGVLSAGRMGNHWGLGMLANGGDCADCDSGDAADRVAFLTPLLGHVWALAYDISATGPVTARKDGVRQLDFEPTDNVQTVTFAFLNFRDEGALARRRKAGLGTAEYGAYLSHRWQKNDVPSSYLPTTQPVPYSAAQVVRRGYTATAIDGWLKLTWPSFRLELEGALLQAQIEQASLLPGVELKKPVKSRQLGFALETELGSPEGPGGGGLDAGYASGDPAPGFGAFPLPNGTAPAPGELDGPQANVPRDNRVDNFRFSPDYRIDRVLFREIIGTVTDALYLRPHARVVLFRNAAGQLAASLAVINSWAVQAASTPGRQSYLGLELDPTLVYQSHDGVALALDHGVFFPGAAFDNPESRLSARTAQVIRARLFLRF